MLTMMEDLRQTVTRGEGEPLFYVWTVGDEVNSPEEADRENAGDGTFDTPELAYADLQAWLLTQSRLRATPSAAQIHACVAWRPTVVTHVVRIG